MLARLMGLTTISPKELLAAVQQQSVHVFDLNAQHVFKAGHVPGAVHLNHESFEGSELPDDKKADLVFYCSNPMCRKAPNAAKLAKTKGYQNVRVLSAGINGWISKKLPVETA